MYEPWVLSTAVGEDAVSLLLQRPHDGERLVFLVKRSTIADMLVD